MMTVDQKVFEHLKTLENKLNAVRSEFGNLMEFSKSRADKYTNNMIALLKFLKKLSNDIYELEIEIATHEKKVAELRNKYETKSSTLYN